MPFISLTTDFGGGGGVLRGVIWGICPEAQVADLSHTIRPQDIHMAAWYLKRQVFYYPAGSIHVVVVDPGVGTERRPLAVQAGEQFFVGPDNGVFTPFYELAEDNGWPLKIVHTNKPQYWLQDVSNIFHGRDIFSPVAAHLATGVPIEDLGVEVNDPVRVPLPRPAVKEGEAEGQITLLFDYLGNIITNIHRSDLPPIEDPANVAVSLSGSTIEGLSRTFGEHPTGTLIALFGSSGYLMVSVVNGSAIDLLKPRVGDKVMVNF